MNEVTRIHLGRQPFTIAVDAHKTLEAYLDGIKAAVGDKATEVIEEVELRMAELLLERGIDSEKTILPSDIQYLKEQLGAPKDFASDDEKPADEQATEPIRRLFRDTQNGMLAGVAAGIASYFGIDAVIIRVLFIISIVAGGWGILIYILLWLLIPEAKTSSERLQMQGQPVTVNNLKSVVERADVHGAAQRASTTLAPIINHAFAVLLKVAGIILVTVALCAMFGFIALGTYVSLHHGQLIEENLFPVGATEHAALLLGISWAFLAALFAALIGLAMVRRKWPIASWATGVILGLLLIGLAVGAALGADIAPGVHNRFEDAHHSITRSVPSFSDIDVRGNLTYGVNISNSSSVTMSYIGRPDLSKIKIYVVNNHLVIDSAELPSRTDCKGLCLFPRYDLIVTINTPNAPTSFSKPLPPPEPPKPMQ